MAKTRCSQQCRPALSSLRILKLTKPLACLRFAHRSLSQTASMGRAPNRRDLGPAPGPEPVAGGAGKIQSRKPPAPPHGKKPLMEPIQAIADKVTGIGA